MKHLLIFGLSFFVFVSVGTSQKFKIVESKGLFGVKSENDKLILPYKYATIYTCKNSSVHFIAETKKHKFYLFNGETEKLIEIIEYEEDLKLTDVSEITAEDKLRFIDSGNVGYLMFPEKVIIPAEYDFIYPFEADESKCLLEKSGKYQIYDLPTKQGSAWFEISKIDYSFNFDNFRSYLEKDDFFAARFDGKWHLASLNGAYFPIEKYEGKDIDISIYDIFLTKQNGRYGYMDMRGELIIPCIYEDADWFNDYIAPVKYKGKYGLIANDGSVLIPYIYDKLVVTKDFMIQATLNNKTVITDEYGNCNFFTVEKDQKFGFKNSKGKLVIDYIYNFAEDFTTIYALVNIGGNYDPDPELINGGKWGYITPTGDLIIDCIYDYAEGFSEGSAKVTKDGKTFYIDLYGNCIQDCLE